MTSPLRYISLFSGIEAASVAWHPLGFQPVAFAEIEPFPSAVLAYRWPNVPNLGDVTKVDWNQWADNIDILVGGSPCQDFSLAGLRKGLDGARGNLMLTYLNIVQTVQPKWIVFENVPGILSDKTHAFEKLLDTLQNMGYLLDADILDAQFFNVAQRRERVFVTGVRVDDLLAQRSVSSQTVVLQTLLTIGGGYARFFV